MNDQTLKKLLDRVLAASIATLAAPLALGGCGGIALTSVQDTDAGTTDARDASPADASHDASTHDARDAAPPDASFEDHVTSDPCHPRHGQCPYFMPFSCVGDAGVLPDASAPTTEQCKTLCAESSTSLWCNLTEQGGVAGTSCFVQCGIGRRPAGLPQAAVSARSELGEYFARAAYLEAASVSAFRIMKSELTAHRAPLRLRRAADRAAKDEVRHARMTSAAARRFGARTDAPRVTPRATRSLEEIAAENLVEGCVRETFGALTALWQARMAEDERVRAMMTTIADDEARHAALSWQLAAWIDSRLDPAARRRTRAARRAAIAELRAEMTIEPPRALTSVAGVPTAAQAQGMFRALERALWQ